MKFAISKEMCKVFRLFVVEPKRWRDTPSTSVDAAVSRRTALTHTRDFARRGLLRMTELWPSPMFRLADGALDDPFAKELLEAAARFGVMADPEEATADATATMAK